MATDNRAKPTATSLDANGASRTITASDLETFQQSFQSDGSKRLMQNVVTQHDVNDVALNHSIVTNAPHSFSTVLDDWSVTNQSRTGRCWMFAGLNLCRADTRNVLNLKNFEFSQNFLMFWDKLERANFVLEAIIETADRPLDDRTVAWLLQRPIQDGGQWSMFTGLVSKYGVAPKTAMPETQSSENSARMNANLNFQMRQGAKQIRDAYAAESGPEELRSIKNQVLQTIYHMLSIHLGTPPQVFDWQWKDKDNEFTRTGSMTPLEFAEKFLTTPLDDYVCLVHDPRESSPMGRTFTVDYLGNIVDGPRVKYLNVDIELMKSITMRMLLDGKPVWMGCDTGKQMHRDLGLWDSDLFDYDSVYGADFSLDKASRLEFHQTSMTHAMMFTGVDVVDGQPRRWRVENSWADKVGDKGFCLMNDSWFAEYMFEIAAPKSYLPEDLQQALDLEPIVLPPWDPMGSLA